MRRGFIAALLALVTTGGALADVSLVERRSVSKAIGKSTRLRHVALPATGSQGLVDAGGLKYFIDTNLTFSTSSSASGAMSEASYTHAVPATTSGGGTVSTTLTDAFDGYNAICVVVNNTIVQCGTDDPNIIIYNRNGAATTECGGRQVVLPVQAMTLPSGSINVSRKVFVPTNDQFARWMNIFTNTGGAAQTVTMVTSNNLGSDNKTVVVTSSSGDNTVSTSDNWATTFQNYGPDGGHPAEPANQALDPRLGHVFQQPGNPVQLAGVNFADGDDNPFWGYTFTLNPGETKIVLNFVTGQPSKAAAAAKAAELVSFPANAQQCMTAGELAQTVNFAAAPPIAEVPTLGGAGLAALAAALLAAGTFLALRRRG